MKALQTLIFFLALQDLVVVEESVPCEGVEGGSITVECSTSGNQVEVLRTDPNTDKGVCRCTCQTGNSVSVSCIDPNQCISCTTKHEERGAKLQRIRITNLAESHSGSYKVISCQQKKNGDPCYFDINVNKASTTQQTTTIETWRSSTHFGVSQFLAPILVTIAVIIISVALIIYCKKRRFLQQKNPPLKTEHDHGQHDNPVYEEIKENRENKMYTEHHVQKPDAADSTAVYCVASMPQNKVEGNSTEYFTVQLPNSAAPSSTDTPLEHVKSISEYSEVQYSNRNLPSLNSCDEGTAASVSAAPTEENSTHCTHAAPASLYPDLPP